MSYAFENPQYLWLIPLCIAIFIAIHLIENFKSNNHKKTKISKRSLFVSFLRFLTLSLLVIALAQPFYTHTKESENITVLLDVSNSISSEGKTEFGNILKRFLSANKNNANLQLKILPFAESPAKATLEINNINEIDSTFKNSSSKVSNSNSTDIFSALNRARSLDSSAVLVLSDGFETQNSAVEFAKSSGGVRIFPLIPAEKFFKAQEVHLSNLQLPLTSNADDKVELKTTIENSTNKETSATLEIFLDDKKIETKTITIQNNKEKQIQTILPELSSGIHKITAKMTAGNFQDEQYKFITTKEREQILLLSGNASEHTLLAKILALKGYPLKQIVAGQETIPTNLKNFSSIILNNISNAQLPSNFLAELKAHVQNGSGLVIIGGDKSFGLGGYIGTALEEISPVKFMPPQTTKKVLNTAVVLLLDKSRSMVEQNRIGAAKNAAMASINALKDDDYIGVIGFDSAPFVVISLDKVTAVKAIADRRIRNLTASGGTNPLSALSQARAMLTNVKAGRKHIIMMSDGQFPLEGNRYIDEINRVNQAGITLSTVALGNDADIPFLKMMAQGAKGAFYQSNDPNTLPQIFLKDIKIVTGEKTMNEQREFPVQVGNAGLISSDTVNHPILLGFVETQIKPNAHEELVIKKENKSFPLLANWKYKSGTVIAFTSDATSRWATTWLRWNQFTKFWTDILTSIKAPTSADKKDIDFDLRYSVSGKNITFDLSIFDDDILRGIQPNITANIINKNNNKEHSISFTTIKKGRYDASLNDVSTGDYEIEIKYGETALPKIMIAINAKQLNEIRGKGINYKLLSDLAKYSGGKVNPNYADTQIKTTILLDKENLFYTFILLAFILIFIEAFIREGVFTKPFKTKHFSKKKDFLSK